MKMEVLKFGNSWAVFGPVFGTKSGISRRLLKRFTGEDAEQQARSWILPPCPFCGFSAYVMLSGERVSCSNQKCKLFEISFTEKEWKQRDGRKR